MASPIFASEQKRSYATPIVMAAVVLAIAIGAVIYFNPHRSGELRALHSEVFAPVTTFNMPKIQKGTMNIVGAGPQVERSFYVVVTVHLQNDMRSPMFVDEIDGKYESADNAEMSTVAPPSAAELARVQETFPKLKELMPHPLLLGDTVPPKGSLEGQVLFSFASISTDEWSKRQPSPLTVHFAHQDPMTVNIP